MNDDTTGGPFDTERAAFESWWCEAYHSDTLHHMEHGCYLNLAAGMAWDAWQAARQQSASGAA